MRLIEAIAALGLLRVTVAEEHVPMHKRFSYDGAINDFSYLAMLSRRDTCSDSLGPDAQNSNCAPSQTLCCTRRGKEFPACEKWLGKGWCCVAGGNDEKCYVDQASACGEDSAVACTVLAPGTKEACCPKLTTCDPGLQATEDLVRCQINRGDLLVAASASEAATASTSTEISSSSPEAPPSTTDVTGTSADAQTTTCEAEAHGTICTENTEPSSTLSGGAIGGIVVGVIAGLGGIAGLAFFFIRRRRRNQTTYEQTAQSPHSTIGHFFLDIPSKSQMRERQDVSWAQETPHPDSHFSYSSHSAPSALLVPQEAVELPADLPAELDGSTMPTSIRRTATRSTARSITWTPDGSPA